MASGATADIPGLQPDYSNVQASTRVGHGRDIAVIDRACSNEAAVLMFSLMVSAKGAGRGSYGPRFRV